MEIMTGQSQNKKKEFPIVFRTSSKQIVTNFHTNHGQYIKGDVDVINIINIIIIISLLCYVDNKNH